MGTDAVALFRVRSKKLLRERLEKAHLGPSSINPLDDGSAYFLTMSRFAASGPGAFELRVLLTCIFGEDLRDIHDDARGVLLFPDVCEPTERTYDAVVAQVSSSGVWLPTAPLSEDDLVKHAAHQMSEVKRMLAEPATPFVPLDRADIEAEARKLAFASLNDLASHLTSRIATTDLTGACVIVQASAHASAQASGTSLPPITGAERIDRLADGTLVVLTMSLVSAKDMIALKLAEEWAPSLREHRDPRGVMLFPETHLDAVRACKDYESAVRCVAASGTWVTPTSTEEWMAQREARSAAFLAGD